MDLDHLYKTGQLVQLKSGGPAMVVENAYARYGECLYSLVWFDDMGHLRRATDLCEAVLEAYTGPSGEEEPEDQEPWR